MLYGDATDGVECMRSSDLSCLLSPAVHVPFSPPPCSVVRTRSAFGAVGGAERGADRGEVGDRRPRRVVRARIGGRASCERTARAAARDASPSPVAPPGVVRDRSDSDRRPRGPFGRLARTLGDLAQRLECSLMLDDRIVPRAGQPRRDQHHGRQDHDGNDDDHHVTSSPSPMNQRRQMPAPVERRPSSYRTNRDA